MTVGDCNDLKRTDTSLKNGIYNIELSGTVYEVYCDMETDDFGWIVSLK